MGQGFGDLLEMSAMGADGVGKSSVLSILWEIVCGERQGVVLYHLYRWGLSQRLRSQKAGSRDKLRSQGPLFP